MKYTNSIIDSTVKYLDNLQYLAKQDTKTAKDIHLLNIINDVYNQTDWYEVTESNKIKIRKVMDDIILNNSNLVLPTQTFGTTYSNVNTPQTIYTWQKVYDQSILSLNPILDENGNIIYGENGGVLLYESNTIPTSAILDNEGNVILGENQWLLLFENN